TSYYEQILNTMPVGLGVRKNPGDQPIVTFENDRLKEMLAHELCPLDGFGSNDCPDMVGLPRRTVTDDGTYAEERRLSGGRVYLYSISYIRNQQDEWCELILVQDFTQRRALEDELASLNEELEAKVVERTHALNEKHSQLVQAEKMASLGQLVAGVAHEINTPLGALASNNDLFKRSLKKFRNIVEDESLPENLRADPHLMKLIDSMEQLNDVNLTASSRIVNIVRTLRDFARLDQADMDRVDIHAGIESTLMLVDHELKNRVELVKEYADLPAIMCFPNQLNQVFMNLLVNAAHAIEDKGRIIIRTLKENDELLVEIVDSGHGISKDNLKRIFDPGFTTKGFGVGTGLGLSIVHRIISDHKGRIEVESTEGKGTTFRVRLPIT
ncbi:MAG: ATP-binding protein, partial [candidate division Zixibacteria bacterium]